MKNNKKTTLIIGGVLIAVLIGAIFLYNKFSDDLAEESSNITGTSKDGDVPDSQNQSDQASRENDSESMTNQASSQNEEEGQAAIDFEVMNVDGETVALADFLDGKPIVINFWASWCPPCRSEMPAFQKAYDQYGDQVHFLMINVTDDERETRASANSFIAENSFTFPVYYDFHLANQEYDQSASYTYQATSLPSTFFINKNGNFQFYAVGALDESQLFEAIDTLLDQEEN